MLSQESAVSDNKDDLHRTANKYYKTHQAKQDLVKERVGIARERAGRVETPSSTEAHF